MTSAYNLKWLQASYSSRRRLWLPCSDICNHGSSTVEMSDTSGRLDSVVMTLGTGRYLSPEGTEDFGGIIGFLGWRKGGSVLNESPKGASLNATCSYRLDGWLFVTLAKRNFAFFKHLGWLAAFMSTDISHMESKIECSHLFRSLKVVHIAIH